MCESASSELGLSARMMLPSRRICKIDCPISYLASEGPSREIFGKVGILYDCDFDNLKKNAAGGMHHICIEVDDIEAAVRYGYTCKPK